MAPVGQHLAKAEGMCSGQMLGLTWTLQVTTLQAHFLLPAALIPEFRRAHLGDTVWEGHGQAQWRQLTPVITPSPGTLCFNLSGLLTTRAQGTAEETRQVPGGMRLRGRCLPGDAVATEPPTQECAG